MSSIKTVNNDKLLDLYVSKYLRRRDVMFNIDKHPLKLSIYIALFVFALKDLPTLLSQKSILTNNRIISLL